jgi:hypothetical protein
MDGDWLRTEVFNKLSLYYAQQDAKPENKALNILFSFRWNGKYICFFCIVVFAETTLSILCKLWRYVDWLPKTSPVLGRQVLTFCWHPRHWQTLPGIRSLYHWTTESSAQPRITVHSLQIWRVSDKVWQVYSYLCCIWDSTAVTVRSTTLGFETVY